MTSLWQDIHYAVRNLSRSRGFSAVVLLTLTLGIGANTAIFSVINTVLLRPLPVREPDRVIRIWNNHGQPGNYGPISYPNFADLRDTNHSFEDLVVYAGQSSTMTERGQAVHLTGISGSVRLLQILSARPILGRIFAANEDSPASLNGTDGLIIGEGLWKQQFAGDGGVIGSVVKLDGKPYTIVGVIADGAAASLGYPKADFFTTVAPFAEIAPGSPRPLTEERNIEFLSEIGRLRPGVTLAQAQAEMDSLIAELPRRIDSSPQGVHMEPLQRAVTRGVRPLLAILMAAAALVLLIACANVSALMLARATGRQREMVIRAALGASPRRLAQQLFIESSLLSLSAATTGIALSVSASRTLIHLLGIDWISAGGLDFKVLAFTTIAALLATAIFGFVPVLHSSRPDLARGMRETGTSAGQTRKVLYWRGSLVVAQVALTTALLGSAGLLMRSLWQLQKVDPGFRTGHVVTFPIDISANAERKQYADVFRRLLDRIRHLPGVVSAGAGSFLPLGRNMSFTSLDNVAGSPIPVKQRRGIAWAAITPDYFRAFGTSLLLGREFNDSDTATSNPVVIINKAAAKKYFPDRDPIGQQVEPGMWNGSGSATHMRTIVGVVADVKVEALNMGEVPMIYWPLTQVPSSSRMHIEVRTAGDPLALVNSLREALRSVDKDLPLYDIYTLDHYVAESLQQPRYNLVLVAAFAALALILTSVGLYGTIAYSVAQRTREIGIRIALGARSSHVLSDVLRYGLRLVLVGLAIGVPAAIGFGQLLRTFLFGVTPLDPFTLVGVASVLIAVAVPASFLPARRATRVDPMVALRCE